MPQTQLSPRLDEIVADFKLQLKDFAEDPKKDLTQEAQKIERFFNAEAVKVFKLNPAETDLKNPDSLLKKDANAACAMIFAFNKRMLEIMRNALALMLMRPRVVLRRYGGSVVETTLAALTAALMWARKAEAAAARTGKGLGVFDMIEKLLDKLTGLLAKHYAYFAKVAEARAAVAGALARMGEPAGAEGRAEHVIAMAGRYLRADAAAAIEREALAAPDAGVPLLADFFQRLKDSATEMNFFRTLGEVYVGFGEFVKEACNFLGMFSKREIMEQLRDDVGRRHFAYENREMFSDITKGVVYNQGDSSVVKDASRVIAELKDSGAPTSSVDSARSKAAADAASGSAAEPQSTAPVPRPFG